MNVLSEGKFTAADCDTLGLNLGVETNILRNIESERRGKVQQQLMDILDHWLNNDLEADWYKLAEALRKSEYKRLAAAINIGRFPAQDVLVRDPVGTS